jgi:DNA-binding LacI/PurR family transcriptional regulator
VTAGRRPGVVAVARAVGVSPSTVSNAFNRPERLSAELRERVLRTAAELGYGGPDPAARTLRRGRAGAVAVVLGRRLAYAFEDRATAEFLKGVSDATDAEQLALVLVPGLPQDGAADAAIRNAAADGLIVYSLPADDPLVAAALQRGLPTAIVDSPALADLPAVPGDAPDFVGLDDAAGAEAAVRHLLELGHRRLGVLSLPLSAGAEPGPVSRAALAGATATVPKARLAGCERALAAAGLGWDDVCVQQVRLPAEELGRAAAGALLDREPRPTALFAFSDQLALGARLAAADRDLSVPGDLSIVGFDDTAPAAAGLTTVAQPLREKGRLAARRLLQALAGSPPEPAAPLPARLIVRESTARPRPATGP